MKSIVANTVSRLFGRGSKVARRKPMQHGFRPGMESLEDRCLMSVTLSPRIQSPPPLTLLSTNTVNGTAADDVFAVRTVPGDFGKIEVFLNDVSKGQFEYTTKTLSLKINGLGGNDRFLIGDFVDSSEMPISIDGGAGVNTLVTESTGFNLWNITDVNKGTLEDIGFKQMQNLTGGIRDDMFYFGPLGRITGTIQGGGGKNELELGDVVGSLWVNAWEGGNVINRVGVMRGITSFTGNTTGTIRAGNAANIWDVVPFPIGVSRITVAPPVATARIAAAASLTGATTTLSTPPAIEFSHFQSLVGGNLGDTFKVGDYHGFGGSIVSINGAGGINTLNFSGVSTDLFVNLSSSKAVYMDYEYGAVENYFTVAGFTNVYGGTGNDILVGNNAANRLDGGAGNDVLIGRGGADILIGGYGNDSLIGGFTDFDMDPVKLRSYVRHFVPSSSSGSTVILPHYVNLVHDNMNLFDNFVRGDRFKDTMLGGPGSDTFYVWAPSGGLFNDAFDGVAGDQWTYSIKAPL